MSVPTKTREQAYTIYRECGQNLSETVRIMNTKHGYAVSRQSLHAWKEQYDWEARAARAEVEENERTDATSDDALLTVLLTQKKRYETYFEGLAVGSIDNQAIYAYNSILKTLLDIRKETLGFKADVFGRFFKDLMDFLRMNDPEAAETVIRNFDDFTAFVRNKYVS